MNEKNNGESCCSSEETTCCKVVALISVDERGQMVLPKELREKADIHAGDKLALATWEKQGKVCCITLIKADELTSLVRATLEPMMKDIVQQ